MTLKLTYSQRAGTTFTLLLVSALYLSQIQSKNNGDVQEISILSRFIVVIPSSKPFGSWTYIGFSQFATNQKAYDLIKLDTDPYHPENLYKFE